MNLTQLMNTLRSFEAPVVEADQTEYNLQVVDNVKIDPKTRSVTATGYMYDKNDTEIVVKLEIDYSPAERDSMSGPGQDASAEITRIVSQAGEEVPLTSVTFDQDMVNSAVSDAEGERNMPQEEGMEEGIFDKKPNDAGQVLAKLARVVKSVSTPEQLASAEQFANLVFNKLNARIIKDKGFGGLNDSTKLMSQIEADLKAKAQEIGGRASKDKIGMDSDIRTMQKLAGVKEGDSGWDDPRFEPRRPEPDEDWEYEKQRQRDIDNPDYRNAPKYEPSEDEIAAQKEYDDERAAKLQAVMKWMFPEKKKKTESMSEEAMIECGMDMPQGPAELPKQQDSVTMNISMNGSGAGGIRDILDILRNLDGEAANDHDIDMPSVVKSIGKDQLMGGAEEGFANEPDETKMPMSAVTRKGNDLHSKGDEAPKVNGGGNPMAIQSRLESMYQKIKESNG